MIEPLNQRLEAMLDQFFNRRPPDIPLYFLGQHFGQIFRAGPSDSVLCILDVSLMLQPVFFQKSILYLFNFLVEHAHVICRNFVGQSLLAVKIRKTA
jgi:hypothetical protein